MTAQALLGPALRVLTKRKHPLGGLGRLGWFALVVVTTLILIAVLAPVLTTADPRLPDLRSVYMSPSLAHPLGTDGSGYDLFSRVVSGARSSLFGPFLVMLVATLLGTALAVTAAWFGGKTDTLIARGLDIAFAFPGILLALLAISIFGPGMWPAVGALAISYVPYLGRMLRSVAVQERARPYIEALSIDGVGSMRICIRHIVPNISPIVVSQATVSFGYALVDLAALSYLGLGIQPPNPDWGLMVATGQPDVVRGHPQESLFAGIMIVVAVLAFNILGERLVDMTSRQRA